MADEQITDPVVETAPAPEVETVTTEEVDEIDLPDEPPAPVERKDVRDYIIARKQAKIEKLEKTVQVDPPATEQPVPETDDQGVELSALTPIVEQFIEGQNHKEASDFIKANPDFEPYLDTALKYMKHPSRKHLPVQTIFFEIAGMDMLRLGAKREREAQTKVAESKTGGGVADKPVEKGIWDLTPEEFAAKKAEVLQRK